MYTTLLTVSNAGDIDAGVAYLRDVIVPVLESQQGYRGVLASASRPENVLGILTIWDTAEDRAASGSALQGQYEKAAEITGGTLAAEDFEQLVDEVSEPPAIGSALIMIRIGMQPENIDGVLDFFRASIVPSIKAAVGFTSLRDMINRESGQGLVSSTWTDHAAMMQSTTQLIEMRPATVARGVSFGETSLREIVLIDLP